MVPWGNLFKKPLLFGSQRRVRVDDEEAVTRKAAQSSQGDELGRAWQEGRTGGASALHQLDPAPPKEVFQHLVEQSRDDMVNSIYLVRIHSNDRNVPQVGKTTFVCVGDAVRHNQRRVPSLGFDDFAATPLS